MTIRICDDEREIAKELQQIIYGIMKGKEDTEIKIYDSGKNLLHDIADGDVVFLDIEMPQMDGIEVGRCLKEKADCHIIMETGQIQRFKEAFFIQALPALALILVWDILLIIGIIGWALEYIPGTGAKILFGALESISFFSLLILIAFSIYIDQTNQALVELKKQQEEFQKSEQMYYEMLLEKEQNTRKYRHDMWLSSPLYPSSLKMRTACFLQQSAGIFFSTKAAFLQ